MGERHLLTGNHAAAYGAMLSRAEIISAYPITPQTTIVELLSELVADGQLDARYITVESEHSAMAAVIGASAAGCRTYTATAGQGLALMHEMLHWAVGARTPVVLTNVSRAMAPGWSIWSEQTDFLSQRDVGWMMLFAETVQEAQDHVIWLYRVAEQVYLPGMVAMDAFILSHTSEPLIVHDQEAVDEYLPLLLFVAVVVQPFELTDQAIRVRLGEMEIERPPAGTGQRSTTCWDRGPANCSSIPARSSARNSTSSTDRWTPT